jgi:hypothetical protein
MEESGCGLIWGTISANIWDNWGKPRKTCQNSRSPDQDLKIRPRECEAKVLPAFTFFLYSFPLSPLFPVCLFFPVALITYRTIQHRKTRTNIHARSRIRTHDSRNKVTKTHASYRTTTVTTFGLRTAQCYMFERRWRQTVYWTVLHV